MKIVLFDFCDTLVNFQTADAYTDYVVNLESNISIKFRKKIYCWLKSKNVILNFLNKYGCINKRLKLWRLKGISQKKLEEYARKFYDNQIIPNLHKSLIDLLKKYQKNGYKVYIVSGGYDIYLQFFVKEYKIDGIISTTLKFKKNKGFSGHILNRDCMNKNKVKMLNTYFEGKKINFSISYSDSISDLPMLKWTNIGVVVSKYQYRKWPEKYGLEQILITESNLNEKCFNFV